MSAERLIQAGGLYTLAFAVFHLFFWRAFDWPGQLPRLSFVNAAVVQVLNLTLTFAFLAVAYLSLFHARDLLLTPLGHAVLAWVAALWLFRAILQPVFFGTKSTASLVFLALFVAGALLYGIPYWQATRMAA